MLFTSKPKVYTLQNLLQNVSFLRVCFRIVKEFWWEVRRKLKYPIVRLITSDSQEVGLTIIFELRLLFGANVHSFSQHLCASIE